jgi:hypothetical protein
MAGFHGSNGNGNGNAGLGALFLHGYSSIVNSGGLKLRRLSSDETLPPGPYFAYMHSGQLMLYEAWRIYNDDYRACEFDSSFCCDRLEPEDEGRANELMSSWCAFSLCAQSNTALSLITRTTRPIPS